MKLRLELPCAGRWRSNHGALRILQFNLLKPRPRFLACKKGGHSLTCWSSNYEITGGSNEFLFCQRRRVQKPNKVGFNCLAEVSINILSLHDRCARSRPYSTVKDVSIAQFGIGIITQGDRANES